MTLADLLARLPQGETSADPRLPVSHVTHDSRLVQPGSMFVAIRGRAVDGNTFVDAALRKGAAVVVSEAPAPPGVDWVRVPDALAALALFSAAVLGDPSRALTLVGVTGTNGKTTTAYLIDAALRAHGQQVGLLGTVQYRIGDRVAEAVRSRPTPWS